MSTITATLPAGRRLATHPSAAEAFSHIRAMAWRALQKMRRNPEQFFDVTVQPLLFTAMFTYIFGGAISGDVSSYLPLIIPGIMAQTAMTSCMATGIQLREDMDKGVFDRFKSLPIARFAPLAGPALADLVRYGLAATLTVAAGVAMGFRPAGGVFGVVAGCGLAMITAWSMAWIFTWLGTVARSATAVQGMGMMVMFPLTFLSNAFVPIVTLPGWMQTFVRLNPVSHVVTALRGLMNGVHVTGDIAWALIGCAVVVVIFLPLAVRNYSRKM